MAKNRPNCRGFTRGTVGVGLGYFALGALMGGQFGTHLPEAGRFKARVGG